MVEFKFRVNDADKNIKKKISDLKSMWVDKGYHLIKKEETPQLKGKFVLNQQRSSTCGNEDVWAKLSENYENKKVARKFGRRVVKEEKENPI